MSRAQKPKSSATTIRGASIFPKISPAAHKLAAILQFGTSYELVEWLARRLQEVSKRMGQEDQDRIMIQKSLISVVEPEEQQEVDRIGRHQNAKNRGEFIQMPPLHDALVEVHREYERASRATKDMVEWYKKGNNDIWGKVNGNGYFSSLLSGLIATSTNEGAYVVWLPNKWHNAFC